MDSASPSTASDPKPLKLRAIDNDDLAVLAAALQDSIACVAEMAYLPEERRFVLVVSRFRWERAVKEEDIDSAFERVSCAVTVEGVKEPKYRGFRLTERSRMMPLLTVNFDAGSLVLEFGGGAAVKLDVEGLDLRMEDFGDGWPTRAVPAHGAVGS